MAEGAQQIAKRVLSDLDTLTSQGRLNADRIATLRSELEVLANPPPPPPIAARPSSSASQQRKRVFRAVWPYNGAQADELSFTENERIELEHEVSPGWWSGRVVRPDGTRSDEGLFPSNYVEATIVEAPDSAVTGTLVPFSPPLPPRTNVAAGVATPSFPMSDEEKRAAGLHGVQQPNAMINAPYGPPRWATVQPGQQQWNAGGGGGGGGAPLPPPSNHFSPPLQSHAQNGSYYDQVSSPPPPMPYGGSTMDAAYGAQQQQQQGPPTPSHAHPGSGLPTPVPMTEEEKKKHDKYKKFAGRMGQTMLGGFSGGVGFGVGSSLINNL